MGDCTTIYVLCPAYFKTGGTELLHQLVYKLNGLGLHAQIAYTYAEDGKYLNPAFSEYVEQYVLENDIVDNAKNILVIPENCTHYIRRFSNIRIYLWWLSVDHYFKNYIQNPVKHFQVFWKELGVTGELINLIKHYIRGKYRRERSVLLKDMGRVSLHMVQSQYAYHFLQEAGIKNVHYLSDYLNSAYLKKAQGVKTEGKQNIVVYNPLKGKRFTDKVIKQCCNIQFVPLQGLTNSQVIEKLSQAKLYIDFGGHPGKDRFPREAAIMKCCVITGRRGAAAYKDVLIDEEFKFQDKRENIPAIIHCMEEILEHYDEYIDRFADYRNMIAAEEERFDQDMREIFVNGK